MPTPRMKFNPGFRSDEEIVADFLVRHADLELVLRTIRENTGAPRNQHLLLVGPRGMGKTTLVLRVAAEVRSDPHLQTAWYPIVFSEESYSVATPGEFWLEALHHLGHQTGDVQWKRAHEELMAERDETRLRDRALAKLLDFADQQGKRLLLVVENLQMLMEDQLTTDDAWVLRETLQNESRLMLLATATSRFDRIENVNEAMYEQCLVHELEPLDNQECRDFWLAATGVGLSARQIRPICILTGGNPRLLAIISSFAANSSFGDLMTNLVQLVDDHTDYFRGHLDQLAPVERKVFIALADIWDPAPARDVASAARLGVSETSAQLLRLATRGAVLVEGEKRARTYQVAERMYNIYYLMRRRGDASARVKALVRFMRAFYGPRELVAVTASVAGELQALARDRASDHLALLQELLCSAKSAKLRSALRDAVRPTVLSLGNTLDRNALGDLVAAVSDAGAAQEVRGDAFRTAVEAILDSLDDPTRQSEAEAMARRLTESAPRNGIAWMLLGMAVSSLGRPRDAEEAYRRALELSPNDPLPWVALGDVLRGDLRKHMEAEAAYRRAVELDPRIGRVRVGLAWARVRAQLHQPGQTPPEDGEGGRLEVSLPDFAELERALHLVADDEGKRRREASLLEHGAGRRDDDGLARLYTLAFILCDSGDWQRALDALEDVLEGTGFVAAAGAEVVYLVTCMAVAGHGREALTRIEASPSAPLLEPLICALRMDAGEDVSVAQEIMEVARDIIDDIQEARKKLASPSAADAER